MAESFGMLPQGEARPGRAKEAAGGCRTCVHLLTSRPLKVPSDRVDSTCIQSRVSTLVRLTWWLVRPRVVRVLLCWNWN